MKAKFDYSSNEHLIKLAKDGNEDAYEELLVNNEKLCYHIANKYKNIDDVEDLASIGKIGLIKAYKYFDITRNIKFATFASRLIHNEILMYNRKIRKHKGNISIEETINIDTDGNTLSLLDVIVAPENNLQFIENDGLKDILNKTLNKLKPRDREIFKFYFIDKFKQDEIANKFNISQSHISRIVKRLSKELQKTALENDFIGKGDLKMATKINTNHFAYVHKNYPQLGIKDLSKAFSISEATVNNYKKKIKKMPMYYLIEPSKAIMDRVNTILEEKKIKVENKMNYEENKIKEEITNVKEELIKNTKNVGKIEDARNIVSSNSLEIKGKEAVLFLRNYANIIENLENNEIELSLKLTIYGG